MKRVDLNPIEDVIDIIKKNFNDKLHDSEVVSLQESYHRVLANDIISNEKIPAFSKSTVDGYAVKCFSPPRALKLIGKVDIGEKHDFTLDEHSCVYVPTGGMIPKGTEAMVMIEDTEAKEDNVILFKEVVSQKENIILAGEDMDIGETVLNAGAYIKPQEIGVLASLGLKEVSVYKKPRITFISTGDELITIDSQMEYGKIREINSYTLTALAMEMGFSVVGAHIIKDNYEEIKSGIQKAIDNSDIVVISGGSSVGEKDYTHELLCEIASNGVLINGMAFKPGKPTIIAKHGEKPIIGLPGHPVSAIIVFKLIVGELMKTWGFTIKRDPCVKATLSADVFAAKGRDTYQMVTLVETTDGIIANPTRGKSGMITLLSGSNGYIIIPKEKKTIKSGEKVDAFYFY